MKIVAVTSCITGIAHTYMAAEALEQAAKKMGHEMTVETQGSAGSTPMPQATIDAADFCIFANDLEVKNRARFNGKPFLHVGVSKALGDAPGVLNDAIAAFEKGSMQKVGDDEKAAPKEAAPKKSDGDKKGGFFKKLLG